MTKNPRITITLQPSVHALLQRLSELSERSQSALVGEMLEQSAPVLERMVRVLEAATAARGHIATMRADALEAAQAKIEAQLGLALETMDEASRPILDAAEGVKRRAGRASARGRGPALRAVSGGGSTPVPVTRGLGPSQTTNQAKPKGSGRGRV